MSGPMSPITADAAKDAEPLTSKQFAQRIRYLERAAKSLVKITAMVNRYDPNRPLRISDNIVIRRNDIRKYLDAFLFQLRDLRKIYNNRKRRSHSKSTQLYSLFYVSDQVADFYRGANLGPVDLEKPRGKKLNTMIKLVTEKRMATSGILTSLLARYIEVNGLKSGTTGGRFIPDERMVEHFSHCTFMLRGKNISKRKMNTQGVSAERIERVKDDVANAKLSVFERFEGRIDKKSEEPIYDEEKGVAFTGTMIINNRFRLPGCFLSDEEREELTDQECIDESRELQKQLTTITEQNKKLKALKAGK